MSQISLFLFSPGSLRSQVWNLCDCSPSCCVSPWSPKTLGSLSSAADSWRNQTRLQNESPAGCLMSGGTKAFNSTAVGRLTPLDVASAALWYVCLSYSPSPSSYGDSAQLFGAFWWVTSALQVFFPLILIWGWGLKVQEETIEILVNQTWKERKKERK